MTINYNEYAQTIYDWNVQVGWWDDPNRCMYQTNMLVVTEVAEATEGERKDLMDDHLPHRKQGEVELADTMIRVLDIGGRYAISYDLHVYPHRDLVDLSASIGKQHFSIVRCVVALVDQAEAFGWGSHLSPEYSQLIKTIEEVARRNEHYLEGAMLEKMEYNKTRVDHTREHRSSASDGKQF